MKAIILDKTVILKRYKPIDKHTHKGIQGHALLIGGSYGKIGSICLASKAALKTGCGLVIAFVPKCGYEIVQISIPEVMVLTDVSEKFISNISFDFNKNLNLFLLTYFFQPIQRFQRFPRRQLIRLDFGQGLQQRVWSGFCFSVCVNGGLLFVFGVFRRPLAENIHLRLVGGGLLFECV